MMAPSSGSTISSQAKTLDRPGMEKLLDDLRAGKVERIVVWPGSNLPALDLRDDAGKVTVRWHYK